MLLPRQSAKLARGAKDKEHAMSQTPNTAIAVMGITWPAAERPTTESARAEMGWRDGMAAAAEA